MAGALGVRLGGPNVYFGRREVRPTLGDGPAPSPSDIGRAVGLSAAVGAGAIVLATTYALIRPRRRGRPRRSTR
jgi:adenosylcobinamide-phosphate synthase